MSGVNVADSFGDDGDDSGNMAESGGLCGGDADRKAAHGARVSVENPGRGVVRREGLDDAGIPVVVGGEDDRLLR